jgi:NAD(P)-dependent dehydrogenase (short-subunit alcohol dehydrogenase family)
MAPEQQSNTTAADPAARCRRLEGDVAVVSGAASGVGRAIARRLAAEGASVVCGDLRRTPAAGGLDGDESTDAAIAAAGGQAEFVQWDVTSAEQTARAFATARERFGRVDVVVANAGVGLVGGSLPDEDEATWHRHLEVNLTGTWYTVRAGLAELIAQRDGGRIVMLSSVAGLVGNAGVPSGYAVTKAGIVQLAKQAAVDGAPHGITANAVCPGYVRTAINRPVWEDPDTLAKVEQLHPLGRMGEASDVAGTVAFLASSDASWVTGAVLTVDGGMTCV